MQWTLSSSPKSAYRVIYPECRLYPNELHRCTATVLCTLADVASMPVTLAGQVLVRAARDALDLVLLPDEHTLLGGPQRIARALENVFADAADDPTHPSSELTQHLAIVLWQRYRAQPKIKQLRIQTSCLCKAFQPAVACMQVRQHARQRQTTAVNACM